MDKSNLLKRIDRLSSLVWILALIGCLAMFFMAKTPEQAHKSGEIFGLCILLFAVTRVFRRAARRKTNKNAQ